LEFIFINAQAAGGISLGIYVNNEDLLAQHGQAGTQINCCRCLPNPPFLVDDGHYLPHKITSPFGPVL